MLTLEQFLPRVNDFVTIQVGLPSETRVATGAHVRLLARMDALVTGQVRGRRETGSALIALELFLAGVALGVLRQISLVVEFARTVFTGEGAFFRVRLDVAYESFALVEGGLAPRARPASLHAESVRIGL